MEKSIRKILMIGGLIAFALAVRFSLEAIYTLFYRLERFTPTIGFSIRTLFLVIIILIWLSVTLRSENSHQKLPWLIILIFEPIIGFVLFMSFGRSFKNSRRYKRRPLAQGCAYITKERPFDEPALEKTTLSPTMKELFTTSHRLNHHTPCVDNTKVTVYKNGETFYPALIEALKTAKDHILMQFFIVRSDTSGQAVLDELMAKADAGVEVKLIIDALGSARMKRRALKKLKRSKIDLILFEKIYFPFFNTRINYRNHRKIVVIDGHTGFTGGMNLADEYNNTIDFAYYFRDTQLKLEGQAVGSLTSVFFKDYYYETGTFIDDDRYYPNKPKVSKGVVQILQSGPDSIDAHIRNTYLKMIFSAKKSIKIMTPYMALDQETLTALNVAQKSGIDVQIIIPGIPDKILVYKVTQFYATSLLKHGISIYRYDKGFCHAKLLIVDDSLASLGSYNLDNRSAIIDFEITALFANDAVKTLSEHFEEDKRASTKLDYNTWQKRPIIAKLIEGVMSIFTPIL